MEADAQHKQGSVHRDQNQSARGHPDHLERSTALRRAERKPRYASDNREPEVAQLTERRERAVELHDQQRCGQAGADTEERARWITSSGRFGAAGTIGT